MTTDHFLLTIYFLKILFYKKSKHNLILTGLLFVATVLSWLAFLEANSSKLRVDFLDVGQGSAIFVESPNKNQLLIDGGSNAEILTRLGEALPFYDKEIDVLLLTHPDQDHLAGLLEVVKNYRVGLVLETGIKEDSVLYREWEKILQEKSVKTNQIKAGDRLELDKQTILTILYPLADVSDQEFKETNESSIVARLDFGQNSFLFTGDADKKVERGLIFNKINIKADFLNVGHHGSKNSSDPEFVSAVNPAAAIIQSGKNNRYGHPHQETLNTLNDLGIKILRNDLSGDINFVCDWQECFLGE